MKDCSMAHEKPASHRWLAVVCLNLPGEPPPLLRAERQHGTVRVLGVAHGDGAAADGGFDAVAAVATAVAGRAPGQVVWVVHRSSVTFSIRLREARPVSASVRSASKRTDIRV